MHSKQPMQRSMSMTDFFFFTVIASFGQIFMQEAQPVHFSGIVNGRALCWARLPSGGAQPIARFLIAPPKPETMWPLKWLSTIRLSAAAISPAMETSLKCLLLIVTLWMFFPFRPSAMMTGAPATA
jgi:hypothetical protein